MKVPDWKPLPAGLDPDLRNFVKQLRRSKDGSGLSLAALAERTMQVVGTDPARLSALWELAEQAWSGRVAPGRQEQREPEEQREPAKPPDPLAAVLSPVRRGPPLRGAIRWIVAAAVPVLTVGAAAIALRASGPGDRASPGTAPDPVKTGEARTKRVRTGCFGESCTGKDPRATGCAGDAWTAALRRTHGVYVELCYSDSRAGT